MVTMMMMVGGLLLLEMIIVRFAMTTTMLARIVLVLVLGRTLVPLFRFLVDAAAFGLLLVEIFVIDRILTPADRAVSPGLSRVVAPATGQAESQGRVSLSFNRLSYSGATRVISQSSWPSATGSCVA